MIRSVAVLALVAACALSAPFNSIDDVPAEYKELTPAQAKEFQMGMTEEAVLLDLIPAQAKEFLTGLTEEDKKILKEVAANYANYKSEDEALNALKEKSPALFEKANKLHAMLKEKLDALGPDAKKFAEEVIGEARAIQAQIVSGNKPTLEALKAKVIAGVEKYKALSPEAKSDIEKQFPITASVFKNEKFQELAKKLLAQKEA